jgi:hypothetical protein
MVKNMVLFEFFYIHPIGPAPSAEDDFFVPLYGFSFYVKNKLFLYMGVYLWVFNSVPLLKLSVCMQITSGFCYYWSVVQLDIRDGGNTFRSSFIVQDGFGYPGFFFVFPCEFALLRSVSNSVGI